MTPKLADFVNREEALTRSWQLIKHENGKRVLIISGSSGMGKSYLMRELQAECEVEDITCALLDFAEKANAPDYWGILIELWTQLNLGTQSELAEILTKPYELNTQFLTVPVKMSQTVIDPSQLAGQSPVGTTSIEAKVGNVGPNAQIAIGQNNIIQTIVAQFTQEDGQLQSFIKKLVTDKLHDRLVERARSRQLVILIDPWDESRITTEVGDWLRHNLLAWVLEGEVPNAVVVISGRDDPGLLTSLRHIDWLRLHALPESAVRSYWIDINNLPEEDLPTIHQVVGGVPLALALTAKRYLRTEKSEANVENQSMETPNQQIAVQRAVEGLLKALPEPVAAAVRLGAIPHWFDERLLMRLLEHSEKGDSTAKQLLAEVRQLPFLRRVGSDRYAYHDGVRDDLLREWQQKVDPQFAIAHRKSLEYFLDLAKSGDTSERYLFEREAAYHFLIVDETEGLRYLGDHFEDACSRYQRDIADALIQQARQVSDHLSYRGHLWLRYYEARTQMIYRREDLGEQIFQDLIERSPDQILKGISTWALGLIRVHQQNWSVAIRLYQESLDILRREDASSHIARIMLSLGDAYQSLADCSGGLSSGILPQGNRLTRTLDTVQNLPFLGWGWLVHRLQFKHLPNAYLGTNYQDWIISYILGEAQKWYQRAEVELDRIKTDVIGTVKTRFTLAELDHRLGRWARAQLEFAQLLQSEPVRNSPYLRAQVLLGKGKSNLENGQLEEARACLSNALPVFRNVGDQFSVATSSMLLGRLHMHQGRITEAISHYRESALTMYQAGYKYQGTEVICILEKLMSDVRLSLEHKRQIEQVVAQVTERHYMARFPGKLLIWFRRLAVWLLSLTYVVPTVLIVLLLSISAAIIEGESVFGSAILRIVQLVLQVGIAILLTIWLYRLVYTVLGTVLVRIFGKRLVSLEREQPITVVTDDLGLRLINANSEANQTISWSDILSVTAIDYKKFERPLELISATVLTLNSGTKLILQAITTNYASLQEDVRRRLISTGADVKLREVGFTFFDKRWLTIVALVAFVLGVYSTRVGGLKAVWETGPTPSSHGTSYTPVPQAPKSPEMATELSITPVLLLFALSTFLLLPVVILWRLIFRRFFVLRPLGYDLQALPNWALIFATTLCSLIAILWVLVIVTPSSVP